MLGTGGEEQASVAEPSGAGRVVAWCLAVAALLSAAGVVSREVALPHMSIRDVIDFVPVYALFTTGLVLAAALALSSTRHGVRDEQGVWIARARDVIAVVAAAAVAASGFAIVDMVGGRWGGRAGLIGADWTLRVFFVASALATAFVGAAALFVVARDRRRSTAPGSEAVNSEGDATVVLSWSLAGPTMLCLLIAAVAMVERAVESSYRAPGATNVNRIASASLGFDDLPIAFVAFAIVALVALVAAGGRREPRDRKIDLVVMIAGVIGFLAVAAAAYAVWQVATADTSRAGLAAPLLPGASARVNAICSALASATLGLAACYLTRRFRHSEPALRAAAFRQSARVVGVCLASAAICSAVSDAFDVVAVRRSLRGFEIGDIIAGLGPSLLLAAGLALAAVIVTASTGMPTVAVDAIAAAVAAAVLATAGFIIFYVLTAHNDGKFSLVAQSTAAERHGDITAALAAGLVATAALLLIWRAHYPSTSEPASNIATLDPVS